MSWEAVHRRARTHSLAAQVAVELRRSPVQGIKVWQHAGVRLKILKVKVGWGRERRFIETGSQLNVSCPIEPASSARFDL